ncbi:DUF4192 domain-containing protein [Nocardioides baculatus]|uniref:DUF4192 domain-containing protein n=1 Tax=Nocardioides baculatus TaxID=2801337 RepID=A0ABS1L910_9ACTN|nr:DUF4192 domain-containing protein [Nocardioides baculatus]MBL0748166.1 DUF4192 domain-containing protein [Nocardioides baculatus]
MDPISSDPTTTSPPTTRLQARTPADLAAFAPLALGFVPERSVVMISVGSPGGMHARVDLPHDPDDVDDVVEALLRPARNNGVREVVVIVYDDDTTVADEAAWSLHEELTAAGIRVREVLRVHDSHWYAVLPGAPLAAYRGVPFDLAEHAFTAQGVFDGRVTHASREALRATIEHDAGAARDLEAAVADASPLPAGSLAALVRRHHEHGTTFTSSELAAVAVSLPRGELRDEAWTWLERADARRAVDLWSDAVRRVPSSHVAGPAAVLAFAAWLVGDGALAWCAVDRCREVEPTHSLASLVAQLLDSATSPDTWEELRPRLGPPSARTADPAA